ncbi:MAG: hypothetical protein K2I36_02350 [Ureaplasma sp.]|nr:hypothetical protein [Ureaplasma sp.]MDE7221711.1 hypothetical protein [Ureaplasma sp.]
MKTKKDETKKSNLPTKTKNVFSWLKRSLLFLLFFSCSFGLGYLTNYLIIRNNQWNTQTKIEQESAILKKISITTFLNDSIYSLDLDQSSSNFPTKLIEINQLNPINFDLTNLVLTQISKLDDPISSLSEITISLQFQTINNILFNIESSQILDPSDIKLSETQKLISIGTIRLFLTNLIVNAQNKNEFSSNLTFNLLA